MEIEKGRFLIKKEKKLSKEVILLISIVLIIIIIDQTFKIWMQKEEQVSIVSGVLKFKVSENTSAAYGIGSNSTVMYIATHLVILGVILKFITAQNEFVDMKLKIFLSFILAGGVSNVIDRVMNGYVTEFIDFGEITRLPIFNIADIFILIGWIAVAAIFAVFTVKEWRSQKVEKSLKDNDKKL